MGLTAAAPIEATQAVTRALVVRAQNGDAEAFAELIEDHYDLIHRTAWKWCGNRDDAEDIAQDVCVKLGRTIAGFDGRSAFSSWVYRITLNAVRDMQRAGKRRGKYADAYAEISPEDQPAEQEEAATSSQLWAAVRQLPEKQRDADPEAEESLATLRFRANAASSPAALHKAGVKFAFYSGGITAPAPSLYPPTLPRVACTG